MAHPSTEPNAPVSGPGLHHVRMEEDVGSVLPWDLGFLAFGALLVVVGVALHRRGRTTHR